MNNQNPSTLDLLADDEDFRLSCLSISSKARMEDEQARGGSEIGNVGGLVGETDGRVLEVITIPLRLGDLDICFPPIADDGSCRGKRHECFISCTIFKCSTMDRIVGLSDGPFWRHFWAMSATVRAAFAG